MIEVRIYRDEEGRIQELLRSGSADGESAAADQGITLLLRTAAGGLQRYLKLSPQMESEAGSFRCRVERDSLLNREIDAILETTLLGLIDLEESYADQVAVKEVPCEVKV